MNPFFNLFFFALLPPFIWLLYFLKKDLHPESKRNILVAFLAGGLITIPAYFIESFFLNFSFPLTPVVIFFNIFIFVALVEEILKLFIFKIYFQEKPFLDEPVDYLIYMITIALGFATFENLFLFHQNQALIQSVQASAFVGLIRFLGPNLLHSLSSGLLGFFVFFARQQKKLSLLIFGLIVASALHGVFNLLIMNIEPIISGLESPIEIENQIRIFLLIITLTVAFTALLKTFKVLKVVEFKKEK